MSGSNGEVGKDLRPYEPADSGIEARVIRGVFGLARLTATTSWNVVSWAAGTGVEVTKEVFNAAIEGESPAQLVDHATSGIRSFAWHALGLDDNSDESGVPASLHPKGSSPEELRERGSALLNRSADIRDKNDLHPAYDRILDEIAPDEARILRYIAIEGPQPMIDVRTFRPLDIGSEKIAEGLSMVGELAGCRHVDRTNVYLNNLIRLGLLTYSREPVEASRYQVVEVQPIVQEAMKRAGRSPKTVRRSIHLTPFGADFCRTCFPLPERRQGPRL